MSTGPSARGRAPEPLGVDRDDDDGAGLDGCAFAWAGFDDGFDDDGFDDDGFDDDGFDDDGFDDGARDDVDPGSRFGFGAFDDVEPGSRFIRPGREGLFDDPERIFVGICPDLPRPDHTCRRGPTGS